MQWELHIVESLWRTLTIEISKTMPSVRTEETQPISNLILSKCRLQAGVLHHRSRISQVSIGKRQRNLLRRTSSRHYLTEILFHSHVSPQSCTIFFCTKSSSEAVVACTQSRLLGPRAWRCFAGDIKSNRPVGGPAMDPCYGSALELCLYTCRN